MDTWQDILRERWLRSFAVDKYVPCSSDLCLGVSSEELRVEGILVQRSFCNSWEAGLAAVAELRNQLTLGSNSLLLATVERKAKCCFCLFLLSSARRQYLTPLPTVHATGNTDNFFKRVSETRSVNVLCTAFKSRKIYKWSDCRAICQALAEACGLLAGFEGNQCRLDTIGCFSGYRQDCICLDFNKPGFILAKVLAKRQESRDLFSEFYLKRSLFNLATILRSAHNRVTST